MTSRYPLLLLTLISARSLVLVVLVSAGLVLTNTLAAAENLNATVIAQELQRTQSGPDSVASVTIAAPVAFVFEFLTNRPHDYTDDAASVAFDHSNSGVPDGLGRGSTRTISMENGETLFQRFLMFNRPMTYAYLTDMDRSTVSVPLNYSIARYELTELTDSTTALRVALVYQPSSRLLAFFVRRAFNSSLQSDFERAAEIIGTAWRSAP
jgi:hypothetical protein